MSFEEIFKPISQKEIENNVFTAIGSLTGNDVYLVTAGKEKNCNAMVGSGGGLGMYMQKPATWCLFRSDRYTLALIEQEQTYTLSYFPKEYQKEVFLLGKISGKK